LTIEDERVDLTKLTDAELAARAQALSQRILSQAVENERRSFEGPFQEDGGSGSKAIH